MVQIRFRGQSGIAPGSTPLTPQQSLARGLQAWYRNDGTNHAPSGSAYDLDAVGAPTTTTGINGVAGTAMALSGANRYAAAVALPVITPFTVSAWVLADWIVGHNRTPLQWTSGAGIGAVSVRTFTGVLVTQTYCASGGAGANNTYVSATWATDQWMHVVFTFSGSTGDLWSDNVLRAHAADADDDPTEITLAEIADVGDGVFSCQYVGLWNRVLSDREITALFAGGHGFDPTA